MKVLLVNNFYYNRGGDCTYLFSLKNILECRGHKVSVFSMNHPQNFESEYSKYFVSYINYEEEIKSKSISSGLKVLNRTIYSREAVEKIEQLIQDEKPDIAHIQNIHHHITPAIFFVLKKYNIPIVWTLHDYTIICPNTSFLSNGKICERCKKRKYFWPSIVKCKKNSFAASTMAGVENTVHMIMKSYRLVDFFIAPSRFMKEKLIQFGIDAEKIIHLNNVTCFVDTCDDGDNDKKAVGHNYFTYLGRLTEEKGIRTLLEATMKILSGSSRNINILNKIILKVVGDGNLKNEMQQFAKSMGIEKNIEFVGHKSHEVAMNILMGGKFLVIPSEWYENFPYSVLESFAGGKPVVGSRIGGIPELVKNWETGLLFEPGNSDMLALKIAFLLKHPEKTKELGRNAKLFMSAHITRDNHYRKLIEIYQRAITNKS